MPKNRGLGSHNYPESFWPLGIGYSFCVMENPARSKEQVLAQVWLDHADLWIGFHAISSPLFLLAYAFCVRRTLRAWRASYAHLHFLALDHCIPISRSRVRPTVGPSQGSSSSSDHLRSHHRFASLVRIPRKPPVKVNLISGSSFDKNATISACEPFVEFLRI